MLPKTIRPIAVLLTALAFFLSVPIPGRAELPPTAYEKFQADAPEFLIIKVLTVSRRETVTDESKITSVELKASVTKVKRSATGLRPDDKIFITYKVTEHLIPWAGPSQVTIPEKWTDCPAFLEKDKTDAGHYHPAAGGFTFRKLS